MSKARLLACPSCARHVRANEPACPFCNADIPASFADLPPPRRPTRRLNRAALYAFGATSIGLATACSGGGSGGVGDAGEGDVAADTMSTALYGATAMDGDTQDQSATPHYGLPGDAQFPGDTQLEDAGDAETGGGAAYGGFPLDASEPDANSDSGGIAAYGLPPH